jgi:undecaprenyl-diphosphatase
MKYINNSLIHCSRAIIISMSIFDALILGLLQGFTEFIPISSSGHLLLAHEILGTGENTLAFDVALHVGTLLALILYFRKDLWNLLVNINKKNKDGRLARILLLATIPAVVVGLLFSGFIDDNLRSPVVVAITLALVGVFMIYVDNRAVTDNNHEVTRKQGVWVGIMQSLALIPGVSRSGVTITTGMFLGLDRKQAARFSFLLAIPIIAGSALGIFIKDGDSLVFGVELYVGMFASFISGFLAIKFMLAFIGSIGLKPFAYYRFAVAVLVLIFLV